MKRTGTARTKAIPFRPGKGKGTRLRQPRKSVVNKEEDKKLPPATQPNDRENPSPVTLGKRKAETDLAEADRVMASTQKVSEWPDWMKERMRLIKFQVLNHGIDSSGDEEDPYERRLQERKPVYQRWKSKKEREAEKECTFNSWNFSSDEEDEDDKFMEEVTKDYQKRKARKTVKQDETDTPTGNITHGAAK
jgi:hypothetical protein